MATSTYLSNLSALTVNSVSLLDQATQVVFTNSREQLDATAFGTTSRSYVGGLYNNECTMTLLQSYISAETYSTLAALVGTQTTITAAVTDGGTTKTFTLTNCYLQAMPVINARLGELSTVDISFTGGVYSVA
jgi:Na+/H+ antiporter NhaB